MTRFILLAILAVSASSAAANWQYTRWGMTLDQLMSGQPQITRLSPAKQKGESIDVLGEALAETP